MSHLRHNPVGQHQAGQSEDVGYEEERAGDERQLVHGGGECCHR